MNWKNWPYWLRGGVIGSIAGIVSLLLGDWCSSSLLAKMPGNDLADFRCLIFYGPGLLLGLAPIWFPQAPDFLSLPFVSNISDIAMWFIAGALIGGITSFFKKKSSL